MSTEDELYQYLVEIVPDSPFKSMQIGKAMLYVDDIKKRNNPLYDKYTKAKEMREDERSMAYIAKRLGYKHASGVDYLLKRFETKEPPHDQE